MACAEGSNVRRELGCIFLTNDGKHVRNVRIDTLRALAHLLLLLVLDDFLFLLVELVPHRHRLQVLQVSEPARHLHAGELGSKLTFELAVSFRLMLCKRILNVGQQRMILDQFEVPVGKLHGCE